MVDFAIILALNTILLIMAIISIFRILAGILLKLTGTQTMFYRLNVDIFSKDNQEDLS